MMVRVGLVASVRMVVGRLLVPVAGGVMLAGATVPAAADQVPNTNFDSGQAISAVPPAQCGPGSSPETGLDGQVPLADRVNGRDQLGYSCNLVLVGQYREGEGANWMDDWYDHCDYYDTMPSNPGVGTGTGSGTLPGNVRSTAEGVQVIDVSDPAHPKRTAVLNTPAMNLPHESLKVNQKRGLLAGNHLSATGFDIYDVSQDCAHPKLLASIDTPPGITGHEGDFAPDGMTYYGENGSTWAMDVSNPTKPTLIASGINGSHGLGVSDDGTRLYTVSASTSVYNPATGLPLMSFNGPNGLAIQDVSQIQHRTAPYGWTTLSQLTWSDGAIAQVPIPMIIKGHKYLAFVDEGGWGNARIIDIQDELHPRIVSRMHLEINLLQNRGQSQSDGANGVISYDGHYCSVPQEVDPEILTCAYAWSGIRVFDIRDPAKPKQIAYYIPRAFTYAENQKLTGSSDNTAAGGLGNGSPGVDSVDRCASKIRTYHAPDGSWELWTQCQENEFIVLKFTNGVYPFTGAAANPGRVAAASSSGTPNTSGAHGAGPGVTLVGLLMLGLAILLVRGRSSCNEAGASALRKRERLPR